MAALFVEGLIEGALALVLERESLDGTALTCLGGLLDTTLAPAFGFVCDDECIAWPFATIFLVADLLVAALPAGLLFAGSLPFGAAAFAAGFTVFFGAGLAFVLRPIGSFVAAFLVLRAGDLAGDLRTGFASFLAMAILSDSGSWPLCGADRENLKF